MKTKLKKFLSFLPSSIQTSGNLLIASLVISLSIANSPFSKSFESLLDTESLHQSNLFWINDGLMTLFFLLVGLEIKRETTSGELNSIKKASLPILAAIGGIIFPALIFFIINYNTPTAIGWGIPTATDIALVLSVIMLLGDKVPYSLRIFLLALAIVDDLGAIILITIFYSGHISWLYATIAVGLTLFLILLNYLKVKNISFYLFTGLFLWHFMHLSGIHPTLSGVIVAFCLPSSALERVEHFLTKPVNFIVMPLFALANANIALSWETFSAINSTLGLGIIIGLIIGKPLGITLFSLLATRLKIAHLPQNCTWIDLFSAGILGGIGFTMSIFVANLCFQHTYSQEIAKLAILIGSILAALLGGLFFIIRAKQNP